MTPSADSAVDLSTPLLKERVRRVFRHLPRALAGHEEPLHQLRVAGRRLRVAVPLLARKPEGRRVGRSLKILRQVTRTAGVSRDLDVMVALFEERWKQLAPPSGELKVLRKRLLTARSRSRRQTAERLLDLEIARLRRDLRAIVARRGESLFTVFLRLREARDAEAARLLAALQRVADAFDPEALHRVRILARRLRYMAEVADSLRGQTSEAPPLFKELQESLGKVRDTYVLSAWFSRQAARALAASQYALASEASALEAHFFETSREHHRSLLERQPASIVRRALDAMGPGRTAA